MRSVTDPVTGKPKLCNSADASHGNRHVDFSDIHNIPEGMIAFFVDLGDPQQGDSLLDVGSGYGAVTKELLKKREQLGDLAITACDVSKTQLSRLMHHIGQTDKHLVNIVQASGDDLPFKEAIFDVVYNKMMWHELPADAQPTALQEVYRILTPEGRFLIWDLFPQSPKIQALIQRVVRKKDQLAGFDAQVKNRSFPSQDDLMYGAGVAGFEQPVLMKEIPYIFSTIKRLETELGNDRSKLDELNRYMRAECMQTLTAQERKDLQYEEDGDTTKLLLPKKIFRLDKVT